MKGGMIGMNVSELSAISDYIFECRITGKTIEKDLSNRITHDKAIAYTIQNMLVDLYESKRNFSVLGWKVGCTSKMTQEMSSTDEPFYGRMFKQTTFFGFKAFDKGSFHVPIIEPEVGFLITKDLPPEHGPYQERDIINATGALMPAIEIVDCRYAGGWPIKIGPTIVDNGVHAAFVGGNYVKSWRDLDRSAIRLEARVNGKVVTHGSGANALGDPLRSVLWLANSCLEHGLFLKKGDIISSGNIANKPIFAKSGDQIRIDFFGLGSIEIVFS